MESLFWLFAPLVFIMPGWLPARCVTGGRFDGATLAWAAFFSVVLLPPIAFGAAMALGVTVGPALILFLTLVLGALGWFFPAESRNRNDVGPGPV